LCSGVTSFRAYFQTTPHAHVGKSHAASLHSAETTATIELAHLTRQILKSQGAEDMLRPQQNDSMNAGGEG
jgi:hypothetical protein